MDETNIALDNKNTALTKESSFYVEKFNRFSRAIAASIVEMGKIAWEAKENLSNEEFTKFREGIGFSQDTSSIRKFEQIGKYADTLVKYINQLPDSWTSIYALTQLGDGLTQLLENETINPRITGKELKLLKAANASTTSISKNKSKQFKVEYFLKISFPKFPDENLFNELQVTVKNYIDSHNLDWQIIQSDDLVKTIEK